MEITNEDGTFWLSDDSITYNADGTAIVDTTKLIPIEEYQKQQRIKELKEEITNFVVPTNEELIEIGKEYSHEYQEYQALLNELEQLEQGDEISS